MTIEHVISDFHRQVDNLRAAVSSTGATKIAKLAGISRVSMSRFANGHQMLTMKNLATVARAVETARKEANEPVTP